MTRLLKLSILAVILTAVLSLQLLFAQNASGAAEGTGTPTSSSAQQASSPAAPAATQKESLPGAHPPGSLLGLTLAQATADFGAPAEVFPVRGKAAWQDDVVFYYPDHSYLFWFRNRVWQVRVDRRFKGTILGLQMGDSRQKVEKVLGTPFHVGGSSEIFILPDRGFPVRARLFFTDNKMSDLYVYRGDF